MGISYYDILLDLFQGAAGRPGLDGMQGPVGDPVSNQFLINVSEVFKEAVRSTN